MTKVNKYLDLSLYACVFLFMKVKSFPLVLLSTHVVLEVLGVWRLASCPQTLLLRRNSWLWRHIAIKRMMAPTPNVCVAAVCTINKSQWSKLFSVGFRMFTLHFQSVGRRFKSWYMLQLCQFFKVLFRQKWSNDILVVFLTYYHLGHAVKVGWNVFGYEYTPFKKSNNTDFFAILFNVFILNNTWQSPCASSVRVCKPWTNFTFHDEKKHTFLSFKMHQT